MRKADTTRKIGGNGDQGLARNVSDGPAQRQAGAADPVVMAGSIPGEEHDPMTGSNE